MKLNLDKILDGYEKRIATLDMKLSGNKGGHYERLAWETEKETLEKVLEDFNR